MTPVFSINAASEILERDRRTLVKALRHTEPDTMQHGQKRYRMRTILDAMDDLPGSSTAPRRRREPEPVVHYDWLDPDNWRSTLIADALIEYSKTFDAMKCIEDIEARRAFAIAKLAPLINHHSKNFYQWEVNNPAPGRFANDDVSVSCRVDLLWTQQREDLEAICRWTYEEFLEFIVHPFYDDDD
jgi:hypothetical protein